MTIHPRTFQLLAGDATVSSNPPLPPPHLPTPLVVQEPRTCGRSSEQNSLLCITGKIPSGGMLIKKNCKGTMQTRNMSLHQPLSEMQAVGKHQELKFSAQSVKNSGQIHYRDVQILKNFPQSFLHRPLMAFTSHTKALLLVAEPQTTIQQPVTEFSPSCTTFCKAVSC